MRVLVIGGIRLYREGLAQILGRVPHIKVVGTAARCEEALAVLSAAEADAVLVDMAGPDSFTTVHAIAEQWPGASIVALGVSEVDNDIVACAEAGVAGYVPREGSVEDLVAVVDSVARGETLCSPRIAASLLRRIAALASGRELWEGTRLLTGREREIVRLIDRSFSNKEIARELCIEVATVKNHVHNILEKLQVHRRGEAAARWRSTPALRPSRA